MEIFWDSRYKLNEFAYGIEPNEFIKQSLLKLNPKGTALFPAEGEGRNAVFASKLGLKVTAFDTSKEAQKKALKLAKLNDVSINYLVGTFDVIDNNEKYDVIVLNFAHFSPDLISLYHKKCQTLLKKNGLLILEGFSKKNLVLTIKNPSIGGPKDINMLFSKESINSDFNELKTIQLTEEDTFLSEGIYHNGLASVIRYIGTK